MARSIIRKKRTRGETFPPSWALKLLRTDRRVPTSGGKDPSDPFIKKERLPYLHFSILLA